MDKKEITNKLDELHDYLDELEELTESDKDTIKFFCSDIKESGYNISTHAIQYNTKLVDEELIVQYEDEYFIPWQLEIYCRYYPNSQQFNYDCEEFGYNDQEKQAYEDEHNEKIKECFKSQDNIMIEIHKIKEEIQLLTDKLELMS
jgi:anion-transporting  ArsA/GET3 family ATPase